MHNINNNKCLVKPMLSLMACFASAFLWAQDIQWERSYGGKHGEYLFDVVPTADYGFLLAGSSISDETGNKTTANNGNLDYWIWKMDEHGEPVWQKSFGGDGMDMLQSVKLTSDGGFLLAGTSFSSKSSDKREDSRGQSDFWIVKLDAGGAEQWQKTLGGSGADELVSVIQTRDGGYLLGGSSSSDISGDKTQENRGSLDYWIVRLDASGNVKWQKTYGGQFSDQLKSLALTADGGCIAAGTSNSPESFDKTEKNFGNGDYWILKLDSKGELEWQRTYGGDKDDQAFCVLQLKNGNFLVAGNSASGVSGNKTASSKSGSDFWLLALDAKGHSIWQTNFNYGKYDILTSVIENQDGTLLIGGHAKSETLGKSKEDEGVNDYIALKVSAKGDEIWSRTIGSDGDDILRKLIETRDGGYLLAGTSNAGANNYKLNRSAQQRNGKNPLAGQQPSSDIGLKQKSEEAIQQARDDANQYINEQAGQVSNAINGVNNSDNPAKIGAVPPKDIFSQGSIGKATGLNGQDLLNGGTNYKKQPASRDKSLNLGGTDFWVVKLKDKDKKEKKRNAIEAIPNPAKDYTNVIVGYEFESGSATLYDINGRQLSSFAITERTVPINLSGLPEGIYIVQIRTNKSTDSVKIIKGIDVK